MATYTIFEISTRLIDFVKDQIVQTTQIAKHMRRRKLDQLAHETPQSSLEILLFPIILVAINHALHRFYLSPGVIAAEISPSRDESHNNKPSMTPQDTEYLAKVLTTWMHLGYQL